MAEGYPLIYGDILALIFNNSVYPSASLYGCYVALALRLAGHRECIPLW